MKIVSINNNPYFRNSAYIDPSMFYMHNLDPSVEELFKEDLAEGEDTVELTGEKKDEEAPEITYFDQKILEAQIARQALETRMQMLQDDAKYDEFGHLITPQSSTRGQVADEVTQRAYLNRNRRSLDILV